VRPTALAPSAELAAGRFRFRASDEDITWRSSGG
jgi:hypothetical protein